MERGDKMKKIKFIILLSILLTASLIYARTSHKDFKGSDLKECFDCHNSSNVAPNHDDDFIKSHRLLAEKADSNCIDCHNQAFCLDCHKGGGIEPDLKKSVSSKGNYMPKSHRSDFISIHSIKAMDNPQNCYRCHEARFCESCHSKIQNKAVMRIKSHKPVGTTQSYIWNQEHAQEARRNLQSCASCHPDGDVCLNCHSAKTGIKINPHPKNFKSGKLLDKTNRSCIVCH